MEIVDAYWTSAKNILIIQCKCGNLIHHKSDVWKVYCPGCSRNGNLNILRLKLLKNWSLRDESLDFKEGYDLTARLLKRKGMHK